MLTKCGCVTQLYPRYYFSGTLQPMGRKRFGNINCGIGQALEVVGDWWSLMIVRDAVFGVRRLDRKSTRLNSSHRL